MKIKSIASAGTVILSAVFGMSVIGYASQEHPGEKPDRAKPQQGAHEQTRPAQQQHAQPQQSQNHPQQHTAQQPKQGQQQSPGQQQRQAQGQQHQRQAQDRQQQQTRGQQQRHDQKPQQHAQQAHNNGRVDRTPQQRQFEQSAWQQHRAGNWQSDHRTWQQRGGYNGFRIPDDRYRGYFGQGHGFRIGGLPFLVVGGYPRFQYGGYWFSMVDPYPGSWGADWYDTDDVYVNYMDNGYYLYNRRYPGVGIAISISM
jgi:hypothetical protein